MANSIFRLCGFIKNYTNIIGIKSNAKNLLKPNISLVQNVRQNTNFFNKKPAPLLWKGVTSVSNQGRRRGRAKGLRKMKNLNKGQRIGVGKVGMVFPGLNAPLFRGNVLVKQQELPEAAPKVEFRGPPTIKRQKLHRTEYGWTSKSIAGRAIGPPDPVDGETFEGFESWITNFKHMQKMTAAFGGVKRVRATVITGNKDGLVGFSTVTGNEARPCIERAKNRAGQRLMTIERYNNHTVLHDFFTQFGKTKIFVRRMPQGYGLVCHRVIGVICKAVGIKDIHAKVEGSTNVDRILKAFLIGLLKQKSYQQLADEKKLHLVELRAENNYDPVVIASPKEVKEKVDNNESLDLTRYVLNDRVFLRKKPYTPFYTKLPSYATHIRKRERIRGHDEVRLRLMAEYGDIHSFYTEKYPEAKMTKWKKRKGQNTEETL